MCASLKAAQRQWIMHVDSYDDALQDYGDGMASPVHDYREAFGRISLDVSADYREAAPRSTNGEYQSVAALHSTDTVPRSDAVPRRAAQPHDYQSAHELCRDRSAAAPASSDYRCVLAAIERPQKTGSTGL